MKDFKNSLFSNTIIEIGVPTMQNIVIYARYSSDAQKRDSIKQQVDECTKYAEMNDMNIVKFYKDEAKTGRNDDRDEFQQMLRDSRHQYH